MHAVRMPELDDQNRNRQKLEKCSEAAEAFGPRHLRPQHSDRSQCHKENRKPCRRVPQRVAHFVSADGWQKSDQPGRNKNIDSRCRPRDGRNRSDRETIRNLACPFAIDMNNHVGLCVGGGNTEPCRQAAACPNFENLWTSLEAKGAKRYRIFERGRSMQQCHLCHSVRPRRRSGKGISCDQSGNRNTACSHAPRVAPGRRGGGRGLPDARPASWQ